MTRKSAQMLGVAVTAAVAVGAAVWFLDDLASQWHAAQPPAEYWEGPPARGGGAGRPAAGPRAAPPTFAVVPPFDAEHMTNT